MFLGGELMKDIMETAFNVLYLVIIWGIVLKMMVKIKGINSKEQTLANTILWAFAFLAIGDTGHVGFRVVAFFKGGLAANSALLGVGKLATAITITIFYVLLIKVWKLRFNEKYNSFTWFLFAVAIIRIVILFLPGNEWSSEIAPFNWTLYRNIPLMILGLSVAYLILNNAIKAKDKTFKWIGIMILISYGFYIPVILFVNAIPALGMLMIPKTIAYLAAAFIAYNGVFKGSSRIN